jgi:hypothetical protein
MSDCAELARGAETMADKLPAQLIQAVDSLV